MRRSKTRPTTFVPRNLGPGALVPVLLILALSSLGCVRSIGRAPVSLMADQLDQSADSDQSSTPSAAGGSADAGQAAAGGTSSIHEGCLSALDERLVGKWKSSMVSNLGPTSHTMLIRCDCTYQMRFRLFLLMVLKESGPLRLEGETLVFGRVQGKDAATYFETEYPFAFDGPTLVLEEADGEPPTRYRRIGRGEACQGR